MFALQGKQILLDATKWKYVFEQDFSRTELEKKYSIFDEYLSKYQFIIYTTVFEFMVMILFCRWMYFI